MSRLSRASSLKIGFENILLYHSVGIKEGAVEGYAVGHHVDEAVPVLIKIHAQERGLGQRPFFFIRPISRIFCVDGFFNVFDFSPFLVRCIRIQRSVLADRSADRVAVGIVVQIVPMPCSYIVRRQPGSPA